METPIMEFKNQEELEECLKYWQEKLFLKDYIIKCSLVNELPVIDDDVCEGKNCYDRVSKVSYIEIATHDSIKDYLKENKSEICYKICHELILIHELLHITIPMYEFDIRDILSCEYEIKQHSLIESLAKTLLMTKYNLNFEWFKNF
jgi:hypothetical protein